MRIIHFANEILVAPRAAKPRVQRRRPLAMKLVNYVSKDVRFWLQMKSSSNSEDVQQIQKSDPRLSPSKEQREIQNIPSKTADSAQEQIKIKVASVF